MSKLWLGFVSLFFLSLQAGVWAQPSQPRIKLNFIPESEKFNAATEAYRHIWQAEGARMLDAMEQVTGLKYDEKEVNVIVFEGASSSGYKDIPMKMRASYPTDIKKATLVHELGHRFNSQHGIRTKEIDEHRVLFLWLYDVWVKLYGKEFADDAVKVEAARKGIYDYETAWKWALAMTAQERAAKFKEIVRQN
jgi:hypothetical protein